VKEFDTIAKTTSIGNRDVPIEPGELITVHFSAGHGGVAEAGAWEFWTAYKQKRGVTARCRQGADPGERFRRMEGREAYKKYWEIAAAAEGIRPATQREVIKWLNTHPYDAQFATYCQIGSKNMSVVRTADGYHFE